MIFQLFFFFFNYTATTEIYTTEDTLSLHDALPICRRSMRARGCRWRPCLGSTPTRSEEHTSELQSPSVISYAVFCLKKKKQNPKQRFITYCYTYKAKLKKSQNI